MAAELAEDRGNISAISPFSSAGSDGRVILMKDVGRPPRVPAKKAESRGKPRPTKPRTTKPRMGRPRPTAKKPKTASRTKAATKGGKDARLLSGGNPQIAKAEGDAPVKAYIAAIPGWKREVAKRLDALIVEAVPDVRKAVKWNSPFYGIEGQGWFASFHVFTKYVKVTFFQGISLRPVLPGGTGKDARWVDVHEDDLDEKQMVSWVKQAAELPGWMT